jgi:hypothetical protein
VERSAPPPASDLGVGALGLPARTLAKLHGECVEPRLVRVDSGQRCVQQLCRLQFAAAQPVGGFHQAQRAGVGCHGLVYHAFRVA